MRFAAGFAIVALAACTSRPVAWPKPRWVSWGGVRAVVSGGDDGRGGGDGPVLVYLHGYASRVRDQVSLAVGMEVPPHTRFVFPEGPVDVTIPEGPRRAWWDLDHQLRSRLRRSPIGLRELAGHRPPGLVRARRALDAVLDGVERDLGAPPERVVLAGFSQGAMVALDRLVGRRRLAGVALLSGTMIARPVWEPHLARASDLPVFVAHGRSDRILPYALAEELAAHLTAAGACVQLVAHDGGHTLVDAVMPAFSAFAARAWEREGRRGGC